MSRRDEARKDLGLTSSEEQSKIEAAVQNEEQRRAKKELAKQKLETELSYRMVKGISTVFDKYCVDGILGFVFPEVGDLLTTVATVPYLYVSLFKIKSIPLTLAIIYNMMIDCLIGLIPWVGDVLDFFHRSFSKSYTLIVGYVEDDAEVIRKVKRDSIKSALLIGIIGFMCYWVYTAVASLIGSIYGLLGCN